MADPVRIAVMGSCITRDNFNSRFNPGYKASYETVLMQNQSSLISLMSAPIVLTEDQIGPGTDYDRWNVATDTSKQFLAELGPARPDYLILDFFGDIHFGVLEAEPEHWVTDNRWKLWPTPYYQALKAAGPLRTCKIERDTETYLQRWQDAYDRFVAHVREVAPATTVIVHRGHNTTRLLRAGETEPVSLQDNTKLAKLDLGRLNELWTALDDYAVRTTGFDAIDLTGREYPSPSDHPWGPYYVHYAMDYYPDFLAALDEVHLRRADQLGGDRDRAILTHLLDRRQAQLVRSEQELATARAETDTLRKRLRRQRRQIAALEQAGPPRQDSAASSKVTAASGPLQRVARGVARRLRAHS